MYRVLQPVLHGVREGDVVVERRFEAGDWADFPAKDAKELLAIGAIEQVPERPADRANEAAVIEVSAPQAGNVAAPAETPKADAPSEAPKADEAKGGEEKAKASDADKAAK
ncbi:hypothetical protein [Chitinibacter sp. ZOR0017]|uniref:hypothetical protein n=1 Tax=Chitinibacter sp. ZOR0017 TaxID=1339254 RepID=UPI00064729AD|nr:hypothetical protein [Chitinibacter sp. ZOR0017]